jgi:hypothetical protein
MRGNKDLIINSNKLRLKCLFSIKLRLLLVIIVLVLCVHTVRSQSLPVGTSVEDYFRRNQLLGKVDSAVSFTVRPVFPTSINAPNPYSDSLIRSGFNLYTANAGKTIIQLLPVLWKQQYSSHHPYSLNDGPMIPSKGYQTMLSAGVFMKYGPLSIQLKPEFVYAENKEFKEAQSHYGPADLPERFGRPAYSGASWGQSSIRLTFDPVSLGMSNENLWWGPGINNSLLMSNSAPGFKHLSLNTTRPLKTPVGSFEAQFIAGRLEASGFNPGQPNDWRYLSGLVFSYQPRWIPGLFLGMTRSFQIYNTDMDHSFGDYVPFFQAFQKFKTNEDSKRRDQLTSLFARWLLTGAKAEVYFEYGLNDHSYNTRDFLMSPEHSRAYTLGMRKLLPFKGRENEFIQVGFELTHLEWYTHSQVLQGYTNQGQLLGAGVGPGGNVQVLDLSWVAGLQKIGLQLERFEHNGDLANAFGYDQWVDFSFAPAYDRVYRNFLISTTLQGIHSVNYHWQSGNNGLPKQNVFNLNLQASITYRF